MTEETWEDEDFCYVRIEDGRVYKKPKWVCIWANEDNSISIEKHKGRLLIKLRGLVWTSFILPETAVESLKEALK